MRHPGDAKRRPWRDTDPKGPVTVADKVRVICNVCGLTVVKMEYNVSLHTRDHMRHHAGQQPDFSMHTILPNVAPEQPAYVARAERDGQ